MSGKGICTPCSECDAKDSVCAERCALPWSNLRRDGHAQDFARFEEVDLDSDGCFSETEYETMLELTDTATRLANKLSC